MDSGEYIWRTVRDSKVRSAHADREGKLFSWTNPPPGGHPAEDYNCRCWAETAEKKPSAECIQLSVDLRNSEAQEVTESNHLNDEIDRVTVLDAEIIAAKEIVIEEAWKIGLDISMSSLGDLAKKNILVKVIAGAVELKPAYDEIQSLNSERIQAIKEEHFYLSRYRKQREISRAIRAKMEKKGCVS